jgi:hypothetical protein
MPKSEHLDDFEVAVARENRFSGFTSRCVMDAACATASASHTCITELGGAPHGQRAVRLQERSQILPSRYSITM